MRMSVRRDRAARPADAADVNASSLVRKTKVLDVENCQRHICQITQPRIIERYYCISRSWFVAVRCEACRNIHLRIACAVDTAVEVHRKREMPTKDSAVVTNQIAAIERILMAQACGLVTVRGGNCARAAEYSSKLQVGRGHRSGV